MVMSMKKNLLEGLVGGAMIAAVIGVSAVSFGPLLLTQPQPTASSAPVQVSRLVGTAPEPTPTVVPTPAPEPVVPEPEPAPVDEAPAEPVYGQYPSGWPVPFTPSSDPNNAAGGDYDVSACASGTASTVNGVPVCD